MLYPYARLLLFAKAAIPGQVKTRLIPALGATGAATLHQHMLHHTVNMAMAAGICPLDVWCTPDTTSPPFSHYHNSATITLLKQPNTTLGGRMAHAVHLAMRNAKFVVLIGADCPLLRPELLQTAIARLDSGKDCIIIPADDGGYVLLALRHDCGTIFKNITWGSDNVLTMTQQRIAELGWDCDELEPLWDVDRPDDLNQLQQLPFASHWLDDAKQKQDAVITG